MKRIALIGLLLLGPVSAFAADNAVVVTAGSGITMKSKDIGGGVQAMQPILSDITGQPIYGTAGTSNANVISVQGIASGTPMPVSLTSVPSHNVTNAGTFAVQVTSAPSTVVTNAGTFATQSTQAGTWTMQPGNTANTTPWLVQGNVSNAADGVATGSISSPTFAYNSMYNGTTWDRVRGDTTNGLWVNIKAGSSSGAVAQGSTTSGQSGSLIQCAVTTAAPTYTTAQTSPISCTTAGDVRVSVTNNGVAQAATTSGTTISPIGGGASTSEPTAVADGQIARILTSLTGKVINLPYAVPEYTLNGQISTAMTGTTSTAVTGMGAQGAGIRVYVTACMVSNTHATVGTMVNLQDGSGGSVLWQFPAGPAYNGSAIPLPTPVKTTANTALFAVNATTGASTLVSCTGYKGA